MGLEDDATTLLRRLTGVETAELRDGQMEAITALVEGHRKALVVQRTGWGKSAVYFIATQLLRRRGAGPTLLVSPLLALMRNQVLMANRGGVRARTINSENRDEWNEIEASVKAGEVDLLLVSPERLNNTRFRADMLPGLLRSVGLLVIDEAHCISDWGHDFRPDYRRLAKVLPLLPAGLPVLCTTATANDRVVDDIVEQLGHDLQVVRGPLERESLRLAVLDLPQPADRLAWLATTIPTLPGSGIVYCLTIADTERVTEWLRKQGIEARSYSGDSDSGDRPALEDALLRNEVKVMVATSALGMGFDKPDLGFVIHYQSPGSAIAYYQQVGRAGRALADSVGILLRGHEDADIQNYFIATAFPPREKAEAIVNLLEKRNNRPTSINDIEAEVNARRSRIEAMLKVLEVEGAVERASGGWQRTAQPWEYPQERIDKVTALRREEQTAMGDYARTDTCRMAFLRRLLDDPEVADCGRCDSCRGEPLSAALDRDLVIAAQQHLRAGAVVIEPRKRWPYGLEEPRGNLKKDRQVLPGRALAILGDGGWGSVVREVLRGAPLGDDVIAACVRLIEAWRPDPRPAWVTVVPSASRSELVCDLGTRLAAALSLPFEPVLGRDRKGRPQREMENSAQQAGNTYGAFVVERGLPTGPVLLVDDTASSRWTLTSAGFALLAAGSGPVLPFVLAKDPGD